MMFKALLLAQFYNLSDIQLEESLNDRVSFRQFIGLALDADAPDHTTLCRFRNALVEAGLTEKLFEEFQHQLEKMGLILKEGTMVDATLVEAAAARPTRDGHTTDPDAQYARKKGKPGTTYGFKAHIATDQKSLLVRKAILTPANVNETVIGDRLICGDEKAYYADKGYTKAERTRLLRQAGIKCRIMHKSWGGGPPLTHWQRVHNALIAPIRAAVETIFSIYKRRMGFIRVRYRGLVKNNAQLLMLSLAHNMRRGADLMHAR